MHAAQGRPVASKAVVVAPATLVANWEKEVKKWLGAERLTPMLLAQGPDAAQRILEFKHSSRCTRREWACLARAVQAGGGGAAGQGRRG